MSKYKRARSADEMREVFLARAQNKGMAIKKSTHGQCELPGCRRSVAISRKGHKFCHLCFEKAKERVVSRRANLESYFSNPELVETEGLYS